MTINESSTAAQNATAAQFNLKFNLLYTLYSLPNTVRSCPQAAPRAAGRVGHGEPFPLPGRPQTARLESGYLPAGVLRQWLALL